MKVCEYWNDSPVSTIAWPINMSALKFGANYSFAVFHVSDLRRYSQQIEDVHFSLNLFCGNMRWDTIAFNHVWQSRKYIHRFAQRECCPSLTPSYHMLFFENLGAHFSRSYWDPVGWTRLEAIELQKQRFLLVKYLIFSLLSPFHSALLRCLHFPLSNCRLNRNRHICLGFPLSIVPSICDPTNYDGSIVCTRINRTTSFAACPTMFLYIWSTICPHNRQE